MTQSAKVAEARRPQPVTIEAVLEAVGGDRTALTEGDRSLTWAQLNEQSNRLAQYFIEQGFEAGDIVGVRLGIRLEWGVVYGALSKIGCLVLGLNFRLRPSELKNLMLDCNATALVLDDAEPDGVIAACADLNLKLVLSVDQPAEGAVHWSTALQANATERFSPALAEMVIYTSGTTGEPKRIVRRGFRDPDKVRAFRRAIGESNRLTSSDVAMIVMPFAHAAGPAQFRNAVMFGASIVLLRHFDPEAVLATIDRHGVTMTVMVPTMVNRLRSLPDEVFTRYKLDSMRNIGLGAAPVTFDQKLWVIEKFGEVVFEGYGSTETGMVTRIGPEEQLAKPGSCGRPYEFVEVEIRDAAQKLLPPGEVGMIWALTPVNIDGYDGKEPFGPEDLDARGFLKTGDMGYVDEDGYLYITDREKDMIVSGGVNIYPPEIEAQLRQHPAIQDAAVIGIPDDEFGEQVLAYVQFKPKQTATVDEISASLIDRLASYKRPRRIEIIEELPHSESGKVLKRVLRDPFWQGKARKI